MKNKLTTTLPLAFLAIAALGSVTSANADLNNSIYVALDAPCRVGDTRYTAMTSIPAGDHVEWFAYGTDMSGQGGEAGGCPQPKTDMTPTGIAVNIAAVGNTPTTTAGGNLKAYAADATPTTSAVLNYTPGTNISNTTIVSLCQGGTCDGKFIIQSNFSDVPAIADVQGYFYARPSGIAQVAVRGGDYSNPVDAMRDLVNWCGTPSETNTCLMKIAPGTYDLVSDFLRMKEWVSIQGSGPEVTKLTRTGRHAVIGADNVALTDLTVEIAGDADTVAIKNQHVSPRIENVHAIASAGDGARGVYNQNNHATMINVTASASGGGSHNVGVRNISSAHTTMTNVTASASGGTNNYGVEIVSSSSTIMNNVTASASDGAYNSGVHISDASPTMINVTASASVGTIYSYGMLISDGSTPFITGSTLEGDTNGLYISFYSSIGTHVVNNKIIGGVDDANTSIQHCRGNYDENLVDVDC